MSYLFDALTKPLAWYLNRIFPIKDPVKGAHVRPPFLTKPLVHNSTQNLLATETKTFGELNIKF